MVIILGLFGFEQRGSCFRQRWRGAVLVLVGSLIGKPPGITIFTWIAEKVFKLEVPAGMSYRHVITLGTVAGTGFIVALFMSEASFPAGKFDPALRNAVKMSALASFSGAVLSFIVARALGIKPIKMATGAPSTAD